MNTKFPFDMTLWCGCKYAQKISSFIGMIKYERYWICKRHFHMQANAIDKTDPKYMEEVPFTFHTNDDKEGLDYVNDKKLFTISVIERLRMAKRQGSKKTK
jgi:hypothetical protein